MKRFEIIFLLCFGSLLLGGPQAWAYSGVDVVVEVVKADRTSNYVDPNVKEIVDDLGPLLNFTGFTLLKKTQLPLKKGEKGDVILAKNRALHLNLVDFEDEKARLQVSITDEGKEIFKTILLLVDKGHVLIGGPGYEDGVMLLRIGGEMM